MRGLERWPSEEVELRRQLRQGGLSCFNWPALEAHVLSMYGVGADIVKTWPLAFACRKVHHVLLPDHNDRS